MQINRKELSAAANAVSRFTNPRSPKASMQCLHLKSEGQSLRIRGFGTYGSASIMIPCEGSLDVMVTATSFCKTVDLMSGEDVSLKVKSNKLQIKCGPGEMNLPVQDLTLDPSTGNAGISVSAKASEVMRCIDVASTVCSSSEVNFANGVRIRASEGSLHFSASTSKNSAFAWCDYSGADIDVVIAGGCTSAVLKMLSMMENVTIMDRGTHVAFYDDSRTAVVIKEMTGKAPNRFDLFKKALEGSHRWKVSRAGLQEFIKQVIAVSTPEASGVWLKPSQDGLLCEYTGTSDGTHAADLSVEATCKRHVPGEACTGMDAYASCKTLAPAINSLGEEEFAIHSVDQRALIFESRNAVIGLGQLVPPSNFEKDTN